MESIFYQKYFNDTEKNETIVNTTVFEDSIVNATVFEDYDYTNTTTTQTSQEYHNVEANYSQEMLLYLQQLQMPSLFVDTTFIGEY